jgi:F420H(2)-dependent quinone reductase
MVSLPFRPGIAGKLIARWLAHLDDAREPTANVAAATGGPASDRPRTNGGADPEPAWWLNLLANPDATVELPNGGGARAVRARAAVGEERARLWAQFVDLGSTAYANANAATRSRETAIAILEPRPAADA